MNKPLPVKTLVQAATLAFVGCFSSAQVASDPYVGTALGLAKIENDELRGDAKNTTLILIAGHQFNDYFALEARMGTGLKSDTVTFNGQPMKVDTNTFMGLYGKALLPLESPITPYIVVGATRGTTTLKVNGLKDKDSDSDLSYGIGADWAVSQSFSVNIEYMNWFDKNHTEMRGVNLGAKLHF